MNLNKVKSHFFQFCSIPELIFKHLIKNIIMHVSCFDGSFCDNVSYFLILFILFSHSFYFVFSVFLFYLLILFILFSHYFYFVVRSSFVSVIFS